MNKQQAKNSILRDERAIQLPLRIPLGKTLMELKRAIMDAISNGETEEIKNLCYTKLLDLLNAQTELAYMKGGRRAELSAEKVVDESVTEFAPVHFSLGDDSDAQARGIIDYLRKISGIDPSKANSAFLQHNAGAIGKLADSICDEVKTAVRDLTYAGIHVKGGKDKLAQVLTSNGVQAANIAALAETLFRTQSMQAYSAGRWNTANDKDFSDYIWGFEYVTAHDDRVREGHRVLDGVRLPKDDPFWKKYFPPNGWNCRCTTLEIWNDDPDAHIDFGITGRDPRMRTPDEMNVPVNFVGNVGMIAHPEKKIKINKSILTQEFGKIKVAKKYEDDTRYIVAEEHDDHYEFYLNGNKIGILEQIQKVSD